MGCRQQATVDEAEPVKIPKPRLRDIAMVLWMDST
jgi:hypothetical protein